MIQCLVANTLAAKQNAKQQTHDGFQALETKLL
jgi:hypothetical protein